MGRHFWPGPTGASSAGAAMRETLFPIVPRATWPSLLARAAEIYDEPDSSLARAALPAALGGFASGAAWMRLAMERIRGVPVGPPATGISFQVLGIAKYAAATMAALCGI